MKQFIQTKQRMAPPQGNYFLHTIIFDIKSSKGVYPLVYSARPSFYMKLLLVPHPHYSLLYSHSLLSQLSTKLLYHSPFHDLTLNSQSKRSNCTKMEVTILNKSATKSKKYKRKIKAKNKKLEPPPPTPTSDLINTHEFILSEKEIK